MVPIRIGYGRYLWFRVVVSELTVQELAIVIAVKSIDPTLLTPEFLRYSQVVPETYTIAGQPIRTLQGSQVTFQNGISILAQPQRIGFVEILLDKDPGEVEVGGVARAFVNTLPNLEYTGVGVNFRGYRNYKDDREAVRKFVCERLLQPGDWQNIGDTPMQVGVNLGYGFAGKRLNLSVNEATINAPEQESQAIALFAANFDYDLNDLERSKFDKINDIVDDWATDLDLYREVVAKFN
jgi:hypothetical protein